MFAKGPISTVIESSLLQEEAQGDELVSAASVPIPVAAPPPTPGCSAPFEAIRFQISDSKDIASSAKKGAVKATTAASIGTDRNGGKHAIHDGRNQSKFMAGAFPSHPESTAAVGVPPMAPNVPAPPPATAALASEDEDDGDWEDF